MKATTTSPTRSLSASEGASSTISWEAEKARGPRADASSAVRATEMVWQAVPWHTTSEVSTCRTENWSGEGSGRAAAQWVREPSSAERISYL